MPGRADAYVVPDPYGFQVVPPVVPLSRGSTFTLRNLTDYRVHVTFRDDVMTPSEGDIDPRSTGVFTVLADAPSGVYEYTVTVMLVEARVGMRAVTLQARGGSDPRIIID